MLMSVDYRYSEANRVNRVCSGKIPQQKGNVNHSSIQALHTGEVHFIFKFCVHVCVFLSFFAQVIFSICFKARHHSQIRFLSPTLLISQ